MSIYESNPIIRNEPNDILRNYLAITSQVHVEGQVDELRSSPIRRTFCLIVLIDFTMCTIFWILRTHIYNLDYSEEIAHYHAGKSLFDTVVLAAIRFIFLEVIYGGIKSKLLWWIAISTTLSSGFVIMKMFMANFDNPDHYNPKLLDFITILLTFLFAWIETIFFVCRVLPKEKAALNVLEYQKVFAASNWNNPMMTPNYQGSETSHKFSPIHSIDDEFFSPAPTRPESPTHIRIKELQLQATELQYRALAIIRNTSGWTYAAGDAVQGCVTHKEIISYKGKMFKIETLFNISARELYNELVNNFEQSSVWNRHVRLVRRIENIGSNADIIYNLSNEALGGYISPRDYVLLRTWGVVDQCFLISMTSIVHDDCPPEGNIVRGEYGLGAIFLQNSIESTDQCRCVWLMNNDIKGRLFKSVVERAVPGILLEIIAGLRQHCSTLSSSA